MLARIMTFLGQIASRLFVGKNVGNTWWGRLLWQAYYRLLPKTQAWVSVNGHKMWLNLNDRNQLSISIGTHERQVLDLFCSVLEPGWTVVDIGANVGYYTLPASQKVGATGRVIAFEPEPSNVEHLHKHLRANGFSNVVVEPMAILDQPGEVRLYCGTDSGIHSTVRERLTKALGNYLNVQATTLDEYCQAHGLKPDLIKVDAEGAELKVLAGMTRTLQQSPKIHLFLELYGPEPERMKQKKQAAEQALWAVGLEVKQIFHYPASLHLYAVKSS